MAGLIKPTEFVVTDGDGKDHTYILSKFDAIAGREIITKYLMSNLPKLGDYEVSEKTMLDLMSYVAVPRGDGLEPLRLTTRALVINHVPDWEMLGRIEKAMVEYNASFFRGEKISSFFEDLAAMFLKKIIEMSIQSSPQSATPESLHSTNSGQSTT